MKRIIISLIICISVNTVSLAQTMAPADSLPGATILQHDFKIDF
ncbi:hypothetical protein [Mucilaginibacter ginsenosidivorax]|nr:hypothetical protein [Mucilaginibacter ginsenosidivorax]